VFWLNFILDMSMYWPVSVIHLAYIRFKNIHNLLLPVEQYSNCNSKKHKHSSESDKCSTYMEQDNSDFSFTQFRRRCINVVAVAFSIVFNWH